ncbi:MAG TPA: toll/interleukin-1 receptor domain-containing protein [Caulobacterales bacterium]|nr:toll/interleukin-1 receptor domain-containing protein [Caulobacterales bacterium]
MDRAAEDLEYRAFVSYSRADRVWAKLLQSRLEHYVLPQALRVIKPGLKHDSRPLKPIFRDEDELVPGADLPARIRAGLAKSEFLIVVCSSNAVASEWVDKEIRDFVALGGGTNILAIVVDGEPNARARGLSPSAECLPAALRFELDITQTPEGAASATISTRPAEPLWIDWRESGKRDRTSFLRLIAALLSLTSLDKLIDRDRAYRRRQAFFGAIAAATIVLAFIGFGAALMVRNRSEAINNSNTLAGLARQAAQSGDWERSARYALLGMRGSDVSFFGFEARSAKDALTGALIGNRRAGPPLNNVVPDGAVAALSRNGTVLAIGDPRSETVRILDPSSTRELRPPLHIGKFNGVALSPDGQYLATDLPPASADGEPKTVFRIWEIKSGKEAFAPLSGVMAFTSAIEFSPDNSKLFVIGSFYDGGGYAELFDLKTGRGDTFGGAPEGIDSIAFSPDGQLVGVAWSEGVQLSSANTGKAVTGVMKLGGAAPGKRIAFAPDGKTIAVATSLGSLVFWNYKAQTETANSNLGSAVAALEFSKDGRQFAAQFEDGVVRVWEGDGPDNYAESGTRLTPGGEFAFLPDNKRLVTLAGGNLRYWNLASFDRSATLPSGDNLVPDVSAFSPDGAVVAIIAYGGKMVMRDTKTFAQVAPVVAFEGDTRNVLGDERVTFSPDGEFVAHQNPQGTWLVEWRTGKQWRVPGKSDLKGAIAFSPDGTVLAATGEGDENASTVSMWNVHTHQQIGKTLRADPFIDSMSFSADGKTLATIGADRPVMLWNVAGGNKIAPHINGSGIAALSPNGRVLVTGGRAEDPEHAAKLQTWDVKTGTVLAPTASSSIGAIREIFFYGDGSRAMLLGWDTITFWDLVANVPVGPPLQLSSKISGAYLSRDGDRLMAVANGRFYERTLRLPPSVSSAALVKATCEVVIPGALSRLTPKEISDAPLLSAKGSVDACRRAPSG